MVSPLLLSLVLLLFGLHFHLLHLNGVWLAASHVKIMVSHAQSEDTLVNAQTRCIEHKVLWMSKGHVVQQVKTVNKLINTVLN